MIEISNTSVSNLDRCISSIGLSYYKEKYNPSLAIRLGSQKPCSGHDSYLKGITVNFMLKAPHYFIIELQRYHFIDIVMSTSKMHSLSNSDFFFDNLPPNIDDGIKSRLIKLYDDYNISKSDLSFNTLLANLPLGFTLKMYMTTNYLQLKNIYYQRKNHRLQEWRDFCKWIYELPLMDDILD